MINIRRTTQDAEGSCNACSRRDNPGYITIYNVELAIRSNGLSFRLCRKCKKELIEKLKAEK